MVGSVGEMVVTDAKRADVAPTGVGRMMDTICSIKKQGDLRMVAGSISLVELMNDDLLLPYRFMVQAGTTHHHNISRFRSAATVPWAGVDRAGQTTPLE